MTQHKPETTVVFLGLLVLVMELIPQVTLVTKQVEPVVKETPSWSELLDTTETEVKPELVIETDTISTPLAPTQVRVDTTRWQPDYAIHNSSTLPDSLKIHSTEKSLELLHQLFIKLENLSNNSALVVDIFHFGDSQIEGDRITGRLRSSWQKSWGGLGPGLIPAIENVPSLSVRQETTGIWDRYTRFGTIDSTLEHSCYGPMAVFSRVYDQGQITLRPHPRGFRTNREWHGVRVFIGETPMGGILTISGDDSPKRKFELPSISSGGHHEMSMGLTGNNKSLVLDFEGHEICVTGIDLGSNTGVKIHNIPMRGSAGMLFKKLDGNHLVDFMGSFDIGMMILQFGGNAAPYLNDSASVARYANRFGSQLRFLREVWPEIPLLIIGPSDMGTAEDYPMVDNIIEEFKRVSLAEGCLFWNLKAVQGGEGAMVRWNAAQPALASSDLVHFTPKGAKEIGRLLDTAIRAEYQSWVEWNH